MNYKLNIAPTGETKKTDLKQALKKLLPLLSGETKNLVIAGIGIAINSAMNLLGPWLIGRAVDRYILMGNYHGVARYSILLLVVFLVGLVASYVQTRVMGGVGQRVLYNLRNAVFNKLQSLPVAFFNQNKAGDLISRINNDTDKLNQFFSQTLMQFVGSIFIMIGAAISLLSINVKLGLAALAPAVFILLVTQLMSPWIKKRNAMNLRSVGGMSAEIQESLNNFKVIVAFNRSDYFAQQFAKANEVNYKTAVNAGIANNLFTPIYSLASMGAQLIVLGYGIHLILAGQFTIGLMISFLSYIMRFYDPLRQIAALWANLQVALAGWDRVAEILSLDTDLATDAKAVSSEPHLLEFQDVFFGYPDGKDVLKNINLTLERGKTYALVGPTGGGKTTTASLMARLYDPTKGEVFLNGKNMKTYSDIDRTQKIGFILQEPFLFTGTIGDNIRYGNEKYKNHSNGEMAKELAAAGLDGLMHRFDQGLETSVASSGDTISLGQKQLIAFIRAVLRRPDLLILDEATANIDTVTEKILEEILKKLPSSTTRVIIAHRLNTIENADEIFFVNSGEIKQAGSLEHAVELLMHDKRSS